MRKMILRLSILVMLGVIALAAWRFASRPPAPPTAEGWIEGYYVFVSPDETGRLTALSVAEGDRVAVGAPLFALDDDLQRAAVAQAQAAATNARVTFDRAKELLGRAVTSQKVYDDALAQVRSAEAQLESARTHLTRRRVASPVAGIVQEIYFRVGETVPANRPIVSLLPPDNTRVRFFVPQATLPGLRIGQELAFGCDGCPDGLKAVISFISSEAEFTPPVIFSERERARLVFRVEARPSDPGRVRVGQPVTVALPAVATTKSGGHGS